MYIAKIRSSKKYYNFKKGVRNFISKIPLLGKPTVEFIRRRKKSLKNLLFSSNFFEDLGIYYLGPCDGNDYVRTERLLTEAKNSGRCTIVHLKTKKGKGYTPAEENPGEYHGVSPKNARSTQTFSKKFGELMVTKGAEDNKICAITAAMSSGTGLDEFAKAYPKRFFDVGIAEEHAATFAAGLCASGKKPVFAVYSTFLQRCYDNLIHDVALQGLPVIFALDRAGLAEADGPTHHGIFDVSMVMSIPGTVMYTPLDFKGLETCMDHAFSQSIPSFIRYKSGNETTLPDEISLVHPLYQGQINPFIRTTHPDGCKNVIITYGKISMECAKAVLQLKERNVDVSLVILEKLSGNEVLPSISALIKDGKGCVVFAEEGIENGGAASFYMPRLSKLPALKNKTVKTLAIKDFGLSRKGESIFKTCGISAEDIAQAIINANES